jgi:hypothetical protein
VYIPLPADGSPGESMLFVGVIVGVGVMVGVGVIVGSGVGV